MPIEPASSSNINVLQMIISALVGGLVTAVTALPLFNNRLAVLRSEVDSMRNGCTSCRASVEKSIEKLVESVNVHHSDDDRHNNGTNQVLLADILTRVMRIETRLFNGHGKPS